jgi:hypothetical protein
MGFFLAGIKLTPNSVSIGLYDLTVIFGVLISIHWLVKAFHKPNYVTICLVLIASVQFVPLLAVFFSANDFQILRVLYASRMLEYFLFIPVLYLAAKNIKASTIFYSSTYILISIPVLVIMAGHPWGVFQYSWELGAAYSLLFNYLLILRVHGARNYKNTIFLLVAACVVLYTDQRSPMIAVLFGIANYVWSSKGLGSKALMAVFLCSGILIAFGTENRLSNTINEFDYLKISNVVDAGLSLAKMAPSYESFVYEDRSVLTEDGSRDLSFNLRVRKWAYAFVNMNELEYVIGLGPGYFGGAADSSIFRIFFETGVLGLLCWAMLLLRLYVKFKTSRLLLASMIINGIFIDVFYSARVICVFLVLFFLVSRSRLELSTSYRVAPFPSRLLKYPPNMSTASTSQTS